MCSNRLLPPLRIGPITIDDPVILAPMSGITDLPYRRLVKRLGAGLVVSEMIASKAMIYANRRTCRIAEVGADEGPVAVQLAGTDPEIMAEAARLNEDRGAAIIDLNFGCPVKKIVSDHAGSALMRDERRAARILEATVKAVSLPVTLKMRTGWDETSRNAPRLARIAEECGIRMVTIHGRTRSQFFKGAADWDFIREVKDGLSIPVIGNGDVGTVDDAAALLRRSGADGVMIGRGAQGRPWFIRQVMHFLRTGERLPDPTPRQHLSIVIEHVEALLDRFGVEAGIRRARKHVGWYVKGIDGAARYRQHLFRITEPRHLFDTLQQLIDPSGSEVS